MTVFYHQVALLVLILAVGHGFTASHRTRYETRVASSNTVSREKSPTDTPSSARLLVAKAILPRKDGGTSKVDKLESIPGYNQLSTRDRSLCRLLVTTTERRLGQIDKVLEMCQKDAPKKKRLGRIDQFVQAVLRIGAVQLLFVGIPPHAAVKETVDVLRMDPSIKVPESRIKFVNAVLRRLSREGTDLLAKTELSDNVSGWLFEEWKQTWGVEATNRIIEAAMEEAPRCLTLKLDLKKTEEEQAQEKKSILECFPEGEVLPQGSIVVRNPPPGAISAWPMYQDGVWWLQDVSATLPAIALHSELSKRGEQPVDELHVVDMCAAPGGKTAQLSNYGFASVTAVERSAKRSRRLGQNKERLQLDWETVVADGVSWVPPADKLVAGILVDAPCTATGTGSKRPDVLRKDPGFKELLDTQYSLACHAADSILQSGGVLVYATCSLLKEESEDQIARLLKRKDGAKLETIPFESGEIPGFDDSVDSNGWLRVLPGSLPGSLKQCDGFFIARLRVM